MICTILALVSRCETQSTGLHSKLEVVSTQFTNKEITAMIPRQLISGVAALSLLSVAATGCGTATGAAVGTGAGAAVGAGTGYGAGKGALIGLGVGAAAGAVYDVVKHNKKD
jgi:hypothetical protein